MEQTIILEAVAAKLPARAVCLLLAAHRSWLCGTRHLNRHPAIPWHPFPPLPVQIAVAAAVAEKDAQLHAAQEAVRHELQLQLQQAEAELEVGSRGGRRAKGKEGVAWRPTVSGNRLTTCSCLLGSLQHVVLPRLLLGPSLPPSPAALLTSTHCAPHALPLQHTVTATVERKDAELAALRGHLEEAQARAQVEGGRRAVACSLCVQSHAFWLLPPLLARAPACGRAHLTNTPLLPPCPFRPPPQPPQPPRRLPPQAAWLQRSTRRCRLGARSWRRSLRWRARRFRWVGAWQARPTSRVHGVASTGEMPYP